jgi:Tfp pilus assembly protein PilF
MLAGRVRLQTPAGELVVASGDAALARAGAAPVRETVARPRDAVAWALYYPPVLAPLAGGETPDALPAGLQSARARVAANDHAGALAALDQVPAAARDARWHTYRAGVLLGVGRVDEAEIALAAALAEDPAAAEALAQRAVLRVVQDRRAEGLADAREAVELSPDSAPARIALSYALQAGFALEEARAVLREAVARSPGDALAWARLAELEQSFGEIDAAQTAAARAVALAPDLARTQMVLGFAALTRIDIDEAKAAFARAIELDSAEPLARLGLGLAKIRAGDLEAGRRELEIAAALDPNDALLRSYLGKAYFEERRGPLDAEQFEIAKQLDPNDPTPWFYDAIRLQSENRPVEALHELEKSIALNDNRAVYRSRLLLDEDLAARGARLGRIYNDLGFEQLALVQGTRSTDRDPTNYAAHRLLADTYASLPRHQIATDSELLQSQLLQPININPIQPSLAGDRISALSDFGPSGVGLTEFTQLFASNKLRVHADGLLGNKNTLADNLIMSGIYNHLSFSIGQSHFETDGFHANNDQRQDVLNGFVQLAVTPRTSIQAEIKRIDTESGDPALRFSTEEFVESERRAVDSNLARFGLRHDFSPSATTLASYIYRDDEDELDQGPMGFRIKTDEDAHFGELRHLQRWGRLALTAGFGHFEGESDNLVSVGPFGPFREVADLQHTNGYTYANVGIGDATFTLGISGDDFKRFDIEREQVNPKIGIVWDVTSHTTFRAAAFRTLKRTLITDQTLEPSHVAGFNQFFDDVNGADVWRYGVALDEKLNRDLFAGVEYSERRLDVPSLTAEEPVRSITVEEREWLGRMYAYWTPSHNWAVSAQYQYERFEFDPSGMESRGVTAVDTHRIPLEVKYFDSSGFFVGARATYINQDARFFDFEGSRQHGQDSFWTVNAAAGYRFPDRHGLFIIEVDNLLDESFGFVDTDRDEPDLAREQVVLARLTLEF